ncbi:MAG TPA: glycosyltransferase family 1 protein [Stellaceae bacterium]|nr:glycosyltransferase family 1 protein [Stellaceae bacterium]
MILFDLSRLLSRAGRLTPTGIDRVELAYAEHLIAGETARRGEVDFVAIAASGRFALLPRQTASAYVAAIAAAWRGHAGLPQPGRRARNLALRLRLQPWLHSERALHARLRRAGGTAIYLLVSHHHLERRQAIARLKERGQARFVCLIHDLIPMEFPEYALPGQADKHRRRIESAAALADAVIVNSAVTRDAFRPCLERAGRAPPMLVAPLGIDLADPPADGPSPFAAPYFVCIGTIEARKNHLLLLLLWRQLAVRLGAAAPRLVLVGQRGWETETAIDLLERCPALNGLVFEESGLPDRAVARLLKGARAVLLPSFAEGFGFPLVEALALGVPVLCSDIPALRENGGAVPEYFDPLDGPGWQAAILDYMAPDSPRRAAQLRRLADWRPASWQDHFAAVDALLREAAG